MIYLDDRQIKILKSLFDNEKYITSKKLSEMLNVSTRTIKKDIIVINDFLDYYDAEITSKPGVGYQLAVYDKLLYDELNKEIRKKEVATSIDVPKYRYERVNYIIKKMLTIDYYLRIEDLMDELYVSRSTITGDLKEVRQIFQEYNLEIVTKPNYGIILEGSEISKRLCITEYFFHANVSTGYFAADNAMFVSSVNQEEISFIRSTLDTIIDKYNIQMSDQSLQNFVIHILVAIRRWKFYSYVKNQDIENRINISLASKEYLAAKELVKTLENHLNIILPDTEIYYFALHLKSKSIVEFEDLGRQDIELVEETFYSMYRSLQHNYCCIIKNKNLYEEYLRLHIPPMVERLKSGLVMRNPQIYEVLTKYTCSTHLTFTLVKIIEENFKVKMNKDEFAYLTLYTNLLFDFKNLKKQNILIVCGRGRPETITLLNEINEGYFQNSCNVDACNVYELDNKNIDKYDLLITTVPIMKHFNIPCYYLENDRYYEQEITRIVKANQLSITKVENYLSPKYFNSNIKGTCREEIIEEVSNSINSKIADLLWEAENIISHETNNNTVFLHTVDPIEEQFIYIGLLKKPIIWKKQWVQFVIFINVYDGIQELYNCYNFINSVVINNLLNSNISKIRSYDDFEKEILR